MSPNTPITGKNFTKAKYNSKDHFYFEELVLEAKRRQQDNSSIGMFYMCVFGAEAASYKLSVKNQDHSIWM